MSEYDQVLHEDETTVSIYHTEIKKTDDKNYVSKISEFQKVFGPSKIVLKIRRKKGKNLKSPPREQRLRIQIF